MQFQAKDLMRALDTAIHEHRRMDRALCVTQSRLLVTLQEVMGALALGEPVEIVYEEAQAKTQRRATPAPGGLGEAAEGPRQALGERDGQGVPTYQALEAREAGPRSFHPRPASWESGRDEPSDPWDWS